MVRPRASLGLSGAAAITGLGIEGLVRTETPSARQLAVSAIRSAVTDAGLSRDEIDGLIICRSGAATDRDLGLDLRNQAGLGTLSVLSLIHLEGASAISAIQAAAMAVASACATNVVCVFADASLSLDRPSHLSFGRIKQESGIEGLRYAAGLFGAPAVHALAARRYMYRYGASSEDLAAVAIAARQWASMNPRAIFRDPLSLDAYFTSRWIAEPFRLYDCAVPVNGAIAVVVSSSQTAIEAPHTPAYILGLGQGHCRALQQRGFDSEQTGGGAVAAASAFAMARIGVEAVDICQFYDPFSYSTLLALEEYGFCKRGEAKDFVAGGRIAPGGSLPVNTGGGHLSGFYLQGMTQVAEAVEQVRGEAGERQCQRHEIALVTNYGGCFDYHTCLLVGRQERFH